jgi:hypothetical protein
MPTYLVIPYDHEEEPKLLISDDELSLEEIKDKVPGGHIGGQTFRVFNITSDVEFGTSVEEVYEIETSEIERLFV